MSGGRFAALAASLVLLAFGAVEGMTVFRYAMERPDVTLGMDLRLYVEHTTRWLHGGQFYAPYQLAGPYVIEDQFPLPALYPPVLLYLTVPFAAGLWWPLWWIVPLGVIGAAIVRSRPSPWQWVALAAILVYPRTWAVLLYGNPAMWALAFLAAPWPNPFVALKVTFLPLALAGVSQRRWWYAALGGLLLAIPFGAMWLEWGHALLNATSSRGLEYTLGEWPLGVLLLAGLATLPEIRARSPAPA